MFDFLPDVPPAAMHGGPLTQVITQVTYNPQSRLTTTEGAVAVHEQLSNRYPRFLPEQQATITAGPAGVTTQQVPQWRFTDLVGQHAVVLSGESMTLETSAYGTWSDNADRLEAVLEAIRSVTSPRVRERLGLRYVNHVQPDPDGGFHERVEASLLGLVADGRWKEPLSAYLGQVNATDGHVQLGLRYGTGPQVAGTAFIIDIDCSTTTPAALDTADILGRFAELNEVAWRCFCACVPQAYREMLTP